MRDFISYLFNYEREENLIKNIKLNKRQKPNQSVHLNEINNRIYCMYINEIFYISSKITP